MVCEHCQAVVARKGEQLEARGRVAALVDTESPFRLGLSGTFRKVPFTLVGHLQKDFGAGPWDEWYLEFSDGRTGWLSESEGALHLSHFAGEEAELSLGTFRPGHRFVLQGERYVAEEVGRARTVSAAGQLPDDVDPSVESRYVDATGTEGRFATLDFGPRDSAPEVFLGERVQLEQLGIPLSDLQPRVRKVALQQARCTQCNGPLELRAPDRTKRVGCPYCGALLDASTGRLSFLQLLEKPKHAPPVPLGSTGRLAGTEWVCIGYLVRSCRVEGTRYAWGEHLLFNRARGFSWLLVSEGHWSHLIPIPAGEVSVRRGSAAHYRGERYRAFSQVTAVTESVLGECYWEVQAGERAEATDYVAPPHSLSEDATESEVTFSHGTYLTPAQVQQAFGLKEKLPRPRGVGASQPNPGKARARATLRWTGLWAALLLAVQIAAWVRSANAHVLDVVVAVAPDALSGEPSAMHFSEPFELPRRGPVEVRLESALDNDWLGVQGDLVNDATGEVVSFYEELSYYSGRDSDGAWTEGSREGTARLGRLEAGRYVLRTTASFDPTKGPRERSFHVQVVDDPPPSGTLFLVFLGLLLVPVGFALHGANSFETRRWAESNLQEGG
nr:MULTISPECIES: DUF4178 domain-containing protein [Myxococcaceae]